jgi:hypothetical protein
MGYKLLYLVNIYPCLNRFGAASFNGYVANKRLVKTAFIGRRIIAAYSTGIVYQICGAVDIRCHKYGGFRYFFRLILLALIVVNVPVPVIGMALIFFFVHFESVFKYLSMVRFLAAPAP